MVRWTKIRRWAFVCRTGASVGLLFGTAAFVSCGKSGASSDPDDANGGAGRGGNGGSAGRGASGGKGGKGGTSGEAGNEVGGNGGEDQQPTSGCGDGEVVGREACDDGNRDPNDGCNSVCQREAGWLCSAGNQTICAALCGDGVRVGAEARAGGCDDGETENGDGCSSSCTVEPGWSCTDTPSECVEGCGDGRLSALESCDDGNQVTGDGCRACAVEDGWSCGGEPSECATVCGDELVVGEEDCDDGDTATARCAYGKKSCTVCNGSCREIAGATSYCGDGTLAGTEACDDGNESDGDGCDSSCEREPGWLCSSGDQTECEEDCGDGVRVGAEARAGGCDDGGTMTMDGCGATCTVDPGWFCTGEPSECAEGCGDGNVVGGEECDDGNEFDDDGCVACAEDDGWTCSGEPSMCETTCGDDIKAGTEECDDGDTATAPCAYGLMSCTVCNGACQEIPGTVDYCGDSLLDQGEEECDDGNRVAGDGCGAGCTVEAFWSCNEASPTKCTQPSCVGLAPTCGVNQDQDCCNAPSVPGDTFNRSNDANYPATISTFRLDAYPVTVGRFRKYMAAYQGGWRPSVGQGKNPNQATDPGWEARFSQNLVADLPPALNCNGTYATWTSTPGANENRPLVCATFEDAFAFCIWDGGRLPSEAEFNFASAGGREQRYYPWSEPSGNTFIDTTYASYDCAGDGSAVADCSLSDLAVVGSKSNGKARWGHMDMAGNVWEWTRDWTADYVNPCNDCINTSVGDWHMVRGGGFPYSSSYLVTSFRFGLYPGYTRTGDLGFRCARAP